jgi:hypothetical protein
MIEIHHRRMDCCLLEYQRRVPVQSEESRLVLHTKWLTSTTGMIRLCASLDWRMHGPLIPWNAKRALQIAIGILPFYGLCCEIRQIEHKVDTTFFMQHSIMTVQSRPFKSTQIICWNGRHPTTGTIHLLQFMKL